jgi:hypothetical protein
MTCQYKNTDFYNSELHWTQNICEPELRHSKEGSEDGNGKG